MQDYHASSRAHNRFRRNAPLAAVLAELAAVGIKPTAITQNGHLKVRWTHRGRVHTTVLAGSPSDVRATLNAVSFLRRQLAGKRP
jgi:hypothetical protein